MTTKNKKPQLILDTHRGVYWGVIVEEYTDGSIKVENMRHCYYFSVVGDRDKGTYQLATIGPQKGSKIGPTVTAIIRNISKTVECTDTANAAWKAATW